MVRLKRFPSLFLWFFFGGIALVYGVLITVDRFTPVYTLSDDRAASVINDNFRRAMNILIEDKQFNYSLSAASTFTVVTLSLSQPNTEYGVFLAIKSSSTVSDKTTKSFKIEHAPQGAGATLDWIIVR
jgi:hypothetical protein